VLAVVAVVCVALAMPVGASAKHRPSPGHGARLPVAERLDNLRLDLVGPMSRIRAYTALWLGIQARVKGAQARLRHDDRVLRRGPGTAEARRIRADVRHEQRLLDPLLPTWLRTKAELHHDWNQVKATIERLRRVVVAVLGRRPGRTDPHRWRRVFHPKPNPGQRAGLFKACPVLGPFALVDTFGAPRPGGRIHEGDDMQAARGTPILAAVPGVVRRVPNTLGGNAVILDSAPGYMYYAHLSAYGASGRVPAGTVIGYVGDTGDARGLIPHLHFEFHPGGGDAVDPFAALQRVC